VKAANVVMLGALVADSSPFARRTGKRPSYRLCPPSSLM
jgi:hypothetical protein